MRNTRDVVENPIEPGKDVSSRDYQPSQDPYYHVV